MKKYNPKEVERKWQEAWEKEKFYRADDKSKKEKRYVLIEFPYPSGEGLHMGHLRPYTAGDVYSRYLRMRGYEVMYPIGWDAFGLPAENYAIKNGVQPAVSTAQNVKNSKQQLQSWGMSFDWSREINTTDPEYYKWTQWIFLQFWKAGLAYEAEGFINWCPKDKTGLANEEVIGGCCERCGAKVEKKKMRQWYLKITAYAEKLLDGLKTLDWPERIKVQQENWIGRSEGAELDFEVKTGEKPNFVLLHGYTGSPEKFFFPWLKNELERRGYKVQAPMLPQPDDPRIEEQVAYVLKTVSFDENTVLVGHSLGGIVALKVLERLSRPIRKTVLAASFIENRFMDNDTFAPHTFDWRFDVPNIRKNAGSLIILRDLTDDTVFLDQAMKIAERFGGISLDFSAEKPHARSSKEPVILRNALDMLTVFTTRPDTLFGATYMVLSPEHELILKIKNRISNWGEVEKYIKVAQGKSEEERIAEGKEKTGVELKGVKAINPATKGEIPIWVADYVLATYGTGAIMAVPAHDERDFEFAEKFKLPVIEVISRVIRPPSDISGAVGISESEIEIKGDLWKGEGELVNSGKFDGMDSEKAKWEITKFVGGKKQIQYRLRDWVFSRQRYWGEPIPLIHCPKCGVVPVPEEELPLTLPEVERYEPTGTGESPLAAVDSWVNVKCPKCGGRAMRETNTMPQWAGSSWYYLRYTDPKNGKEFAGKKLMERWLPVDVYFGGLEHTTLHLLYSRFWHQFLHDEGLVPTPEPYAKRVPHGIVLGPDGEKMSKSRGNVVSPDEIVKNFGADCLRMYELFLGPHEATVSWKSEGILGISRFLERVWKFFGKEKGIDVPLSPLLHRTVKKVTEDIEAFHYNTAISALMILLNDFERNGAAGEAGEIFLKLLAPFAPHITEEIWQQLHAEKIARAYGSQRPPASASSAGEWRAGSSASSPRKSAFSSIHREAWPKYDPNFIKEETFTLVIQVNGRVRDTVEAATGMDESALKDLALGREKIKNILGSQKPKRVIYVRGKLVNIVL